MGKRMPHTRFKMRFVSGEALSLYQRPSVPIDRTVPFFMPTEVGIHAFYMRKQRHGWRAFARRDG